MATPTARVRAAELGGHRRRTRRAYRSATTTLAPSRRERPDGRETDAGGPAGDQGDLAGQRLRCRSALELVLLELPVLDRELLRLVDRRVGRDALGAAHHVDGVDVELAGDPGGLLVRAEREHARRRAPGRWPGRRRASPASPGWRAGRSRRGTPSRYSACSSASRATTSSIGASDRGVQQQRPDLGPQEVVGAARCPRRPRCASFSRDRKSSTTSRVGEVADLPAVRRGDRRAGAGTAPPPWPAAPPGSAPRGRPPPARTARRPTCSSR